MECRKNLGSTFIYLLKNQKQKHLHIFSVIEVLLIGNTFIVVLYNILSLLSFNVFFS